VRFDDATQSVIRGILLKVSEDVEHFTRAQAQQRTEHREGALDSQLIRHVEARHSWMRRRSRIAIVRLYRWYCSAKFRTTSIVTLVTSIDGALGPKIGGRRSS
jgi:hypothetical protein